MAVARNADRGQTMTAKREALRERISKKTERICDIVDSIDQLACYLKVNVDDDKKPIIWRGPIIGKMIREFFENSEWGELDYLIIDLSPGTSDAPLSLIQLLDLDGFLLVTTPHHIAALNTIRSGMMAKRLGSSILGVVENMSDGNPKGAREVADALGCEVLGAIKYDKRFGELSDAGKIPSEEDAEIKEEFIRIIKKIIS